MISMQCMVEDHFYDIYLIFDYFAFTPKCSGVTEFK